jgi:hypothetical protein
MRQVENPVVDASIVPTIPRASAKLPTLMIAGKLAAAMPAA